MLTRKGGYLFPRRAPGPTVSRTIEQEGWAVLPGLLDAGEVAALSSEVEAIYTSLPADRRNPRLSAEEADDFRYEMLNRSARAQATVAHPKLLEVIEPLLGEDCHVIANTCWRNPPRPANQHGGGAWHIDAGPHIPRDPSIPWDERIPYPIFAIGVHVYLRDCPVDCGPTGVIPGSHRSGQPPPMDRLHDPELTWQGRAPVVLEARAGDAALFVSDVWHRRMPCGPGDTGRLFLQIHYGRRDLAQRLRTTAEANQLSADAMTRARSPRERTVIGLHPPFFYDG
ncbi:MAG: phytanoyl-CoA dioxygenase family protein [Pseudomonadales bacterium]|nr:phytanoyl-CoA dioxygenase family protein [Pseudomonadales bacterium]